MFILQLFYIVPKILFYYHLFLGSNYVQLC